MSLVFRPLGTVRAGLAIALVFRLECQHTKTQWSAHISHLSHFILFFVIFLLGFVTVFRCEVSPLTSVPGSLSVATLSAPLVFLSVDGLLGSFALLGLDEPPILLLLF